MDRLHNTMVKQMEEAEEDLNQEAELRQTKTRKTSVSTACQTDKVSRKVSHVVRTPASQLRQVGQVAEQDTPVTRCLSHLSTGAVRGSSLEKSSCDDDGVMTLRQCNDTLVSFIERARVLAQASDIRDCLPDKLTETTSVSLESGVLEQMFEEEIRKLQEKLADTEQKRRSRTSELRLLEEENNMLKMNCERGVSELSMMETQIAETELSVQNSVMEVRDVPKLESLKEADV